MTAQEAIRDIQRLSSSCKHSGDCMACNICYKAVPMAIECMEEVEQYRALGTVEEIKKKIKTELPYMSLAQARFKSELDEYRKIGTVEELKEAREKQVAKKPIKSKRIGHAYYYCPNCDASVTIEIDHGCERDYRLDHCDVCGQKIDWSESE